MNSIMNTTLSSMRALILDDYEVAQFRSAQIDIPAPKAGEVLVRIKASGVNPIDYKIRTGKALYAMPALPTCWVRTSPAWSRPSAKV